MSRRSLWFSSWSLILGEHKPEDRRTMFVVDDVYTFLRKSTTKGPWIYFDKYLSTTIANFFKKKIFFREFLDLVCEAVIFGSGWWCCSWRAYFFQSRREGGRNSKSSSRIRWTQYILKISTASGVLAKSFFRKAISFDGEIFFIVLTGRRKHLCSLVHERGEDGFFSCRRLGRRGVVERWWSSKNNFDPGFFFQDEIIDKKWRRGKHFMFLLIKDEMSIQGSKRHKMSISEFLWFKERGWFSVKNRCRSKRGRSFFFSNYIEKWGIDNLYILQLFQEGPCSSEVFSGFYLNGEAGDVFFLWRIWISQKWYEEEGIIYYHSFLFVFFSSGKKDRFFLSIRRIMRSIGLFGKKNRRKKKAYVQGREKDEIVFFSLGCFF